jgi:NADH-quinone oxidoreductase subunit L
MTGILGAALPLVPFVMALLGFLLRNRSRFAAWYGILGAAVVLGAAIALVVTLPGPYEASREVANFGALPITFGVRLDSAAAFVAVAVCTVALAVQVYSTAYLRGDDRYAPYAAQVSLFTAAMLLVVVASDLIQLLIGWEVMGVCSYLLIGHDRRLPEAPAAAVKAFLVTRVGDIGFLLGIVVLGVNAGSFAIGDTLMPGLLSPTTTTVVCLLLLAGVAGKSAQFPLHTWLPDAMAGPTPISALIHAATMVAAGVYVVTRLYPLFAASAVALAVMAAMAAVTMLLGALAATAQDDIKRVLAWSTVSQIAYMIGALAVGAPAAALFHLLTHAAFKALLFLAAGVVIHSVGTNLMSGMGGLRRLMPATFWCMTIGLGALIGLPPLAGFWSKEAILHAAAEGSGYRFLLVYGVGLATVFVTAAYATRLWLRVFFGHRAGHPVGHSARHSFGHSARHSFGHSARHSFGHSARHSFGHSAGHEAPRTMAWPVLGLAGASAVVGLLSLVPGFAERLGAGDAFSITAQAAAPLGCALLGVAATWWIWRLRLGADPARVLGPLAPVFGQAFYLDALQRTLVVHPVTALACVVRRGDESVVDGVVGGIGIGTLNLGGAVSTAHRAGLPRALSAVLGGALLLGLLAFAIVGVLP